MPFASAVARCLRSGLIAAGASFATLGGATAVQPRMLLLDAALSGTDVVVVGERGTILRSPDRGATWQAASSTTRATLTGVAFAPGEAAASGWAVGHDSLILATTDGGRTWSKQHQGDNLQDSFLDVLALDGSRIYAVGAYGLFVGSTDGGRTWAARKIGDTDSHFNRITRGASGALYLAGERGLLLRSTDAGGTWTPLPPPYDGSFYGLLELQPRTLLAYGLQGEVHRSDDDGATWRRIATPRPVLLATAATRGRELLFAGQARTLFVSPDGGATITAHPAPPATAIAELLPLPDGSLLAVGEAGVSLLSAP